MDNKSLSFITYAHRGASHYCPENTLMSFYEGMKMGANGIETDVQRTKDGVLVLFHDDTLERVTGEKGCVADYTFSELNKFLVKHGDITDKIPSFEDFLSHFSYRDITFAIELKIGGIEKEVAELIYKHGIQKKAVVTSFKLDYLKKIKAIAPELEIGYLTNNITEKTVAELKSIGAEEICPEGCEVTAEKVKHWHSEGLRVRAWGISNAEIMKAVYDAGADGMTVNFPDLLLNYIKERT